MVLRARARIACAKLERGWHVPERSEGRGLRTCRPFVPQGVPPKLSNLFSRGPLVSFSRIICCASGPNDGSLSRSGARFANGGRHRLVEWNRPDHRPGTCAAGAAVLIHARQNGQAAESVAEEARAIGAEAKVALINLTDSTGHEALVEQAWDWHGGVHIWVNNAGADVLTGHQAGWSFEEKLEALWRINVAATVPLVAAGRPANEDGRARRHA